MIALACRPFILQLHVVSQQDCLVPASLQGHLPHDVSLHGTVHCICVLGLGLFGWRAWWVALQQTLDWPTCKVTEVSWQNDLASLKEYVP